VIEVYSLRMQCGGASTNLEAAVLKMRFVIFFVRVLGLIAILSCVQIVHIGIGGPVPTLFSGQSGSVFFDILAESDAVLTEKSGVVQRVAVLESMFPIANNAVGFIRQVVILLDGVDTHPVHAVEL